MKFETKLGRLLKNVMSVAKMRRKGARNRSLQIVNEDFEPLFNEILASVIDFQQPVRRGVAQNRLRQSVAALLRARPLVYLTEMSRVLCAVRLALARLAPVFGVRQCHAGEYINPDCAGWTDQDNSGLLSRASSRLRTFCQGSRPGQVSVSIFTSLSAE